MMNRSNFVIFCVMLSVFFIVFIMYGLYFHPEFFENKTINQNASIYNGTGNWSSYLGKPINHSNFGMVYFTEPNYSQVPILEISTNYTALMRIWKNGSIWIKEGTEMELGEQLVKMAIAYGAYADGFCEGRKSK